MLSLFYVSLSVVYFNQGTGALHWVCWYKIFFFTFALFSSFCILFALFSSFWWERDKNEEKRKKCLFPTADKQLNADPESGKKLCSWLLQLISTNYYHFFINFRCYGCQLAFWINHFMMFFFFFLNFFSLFHVKSKQKKEKHFKKWELAYFDQQTLVKKHNTFHYPVAAFMKF